MDKNGPIVVATTLCIVTMLTALAISASLFLEMIEMDKELHNGMAEFKVCQFYQKLIF